MLGRQRSLLSAPASSALLLQQAARRPRPVAAMVSQARAISGGKPQKVNVQSIVEADTGAVGTKYYHLMNTSLLVAAPLALFISPSALTFPIDLFLGVAFPLHAHVGFNYIISDYVPKASRPLARYALLGVTGLTLLGLLKLNLFGPGITESYKSLWREEQEAKQGKK